MTKEDILNRVNIYKLGDIKEGIVNYPYTFEIYENNKFEHIVGKISVFYIGIDDERIKCFRKTDGKILLANYTDLI